MLFRNREKPVKCKISPLILSLVDSIPLDNIPSLQWGKKHESTAAESFMRHEGGKHIVPKLIPAGLYILKSHPYLGATPDHIFICQCCVNTCVEYKCPYSIKDKSIEEAWDKTQFLEMFNNKIRLKRTHKYYTRQTYFVVWTTKGAPFIEKIDFDNAYWKKVLANLIVFFKSYIQSYLLKVTFAPYRFLATTRKNDINRNFTLN